ncbi:MAG TPA: hypothetical protein VE196_04150 [Pseudonocardiaceae bacterium]|jgi:hypothetical protein|nr:hypothetical protein [Pseudonocardiaceae bacterium]
MALEVLRTIADATVGCGEDMRLAVIIDDIHLFDQPSAAAHLSSSLSGPRSKRPMRVVALRKCLNESSFLSRSSAAAAQAG